MSDITALQALVPVLRERADAGAADFALGNSPDVGRSTNETNAALQVLDDTVKHATADVAGIADALQASIDAYAAQDAAVAAQLSGMGKTP